MMPDYVWAILGAFGFMILWNIVLSSEMDDLKKKIDNLEHEIWRIKRQ